MGDRRWGIRRGSHEASELPESVSAIAESRRGGGNRRPSHAGSAGADKVSAMAESLSGGSLRDSQLGSGGPTASYVRSDGAHERSL